MITKKVLWILLMTVFPLLSVTAQSVNDDNDYQKYLEDQRKTEEAIDIIENSVSLNARRKKRWRSIVEKCSSGKKKPG